MGGYRSKPVTEKVSDGGEFKKRNLKVIYGATAMQGWRKAMEDAHSIVPDFDAQSSLFGVFDGHGGQEVATYCATHLPDIIRSCYSNRDLGQAMKDAFMKCDRIVMEHDAIMEMKTYHVKDEVSADEDDMETKEELDNLLEESTMPLKSLLAQYDSPLQEKSKDEESGHIKQQGINTILKLLCNSEVELDTSSDDEEDGEDTTEEEDEEDDEKIEKEDGLSKDDDARDEVSSTTQDDKEEVQKELPGPLASGDSERSVASSTAMRENSTELKQNTALADSSSTVTSTSPKGVPERLLKREESTVKFTLLELLKSGPLEANSGRRSRKRVYPDRDIEEESPKKSVPNRPKEGYCSGTTAVVGILREKEFIVANAGDSKCVLSSKGKAVDMSVDHKPTDIVELNRIENAGGRVGRDERVNGGLNLSRAIGDHFYKENFELSLEDQMISAMPDIKSFQLTEDEHFIVFACDGIWNSLTSQEVVDFIYARFKEENIEVPTPEQLIKICERLCDICLADDTNNDGVGCDNMTCIIIYLAR